MLLLLTSFIIRKFDKKTEEEGYDSDASEDTNAGVSLTASNANVSKYMNLLVSIIMIMLTG